MRLCSIFFIDSGPSKEIKKTLGINRSFDLMANSNLPRRIIKVRCLDDDLVSRVSDLLILFFFPVQETQRLLSEPGIDADHVG